MKANQEEWCQSPVENYHFKHCLLTYNNSIPAFGLRRKYLKEFLSLSMYLFSNHSVKYLVKKLSF